MTVHRLLMLINLGSGCLMLALWLHLSEQNPFVSLLLVFGMFSVVNGVMNWKAR